jgi:hypothetical protein
MIRAWVKRVEVAYDQVNVVFRIAPRPGDPSPEKKSWQHCRRSPHASLGRAFRRVVPPPMFPIAGLQPWFDQLPSWPRAKAVQETGLADMVKGPWAIGVQDVVVWADGPVAECHVDLLEGLLAAASGATAVAWRVDLGFKPRVQGVVDDHWPPPITPRRDAQRPLFAVGRGNRDAPHRGSLPGVRLPQGVDQLGTRLWRGHTFPVDPWRMPPAVHLSDTPDRHPHVGVPASEPCGEVTPLFPTRLLGRSDDPRAQALDDPLGRAPVELVPGGGRTATGVRCREWPNRSGRVDPRRSSCSSSSPGGTSAPLQGGALHLRGGPLPPMTGGPSLPTGHNLRTTPNDGL